MFDFLNEHRDRIVALAPRREALETPIKVSTHTYDMGYREGQTYKTIEVLNE